MVFCIRAQHWPRPESLGPGGLEQCLVGSAREKLTVQRAGDGGGITRWPIPGASAH